jgi:histidinol dehydrogenase
MYPETNTLPKQHTSPLQGEVVDAEIFNLLAEATGSAALNIWMKLDAGTPEWYKKINRSDITHAELVSKIKEFAACAPLTIQTMLCAIDGDLPPPEEAQAWENLVLELVAIADNGTGSIRKIQIYGKARASPDDPKASPLPLAYLEQRAASLRRFFPRVAVYN